MSGQELVTYNNTEAPLCFNDWTLAKFVLGAHSQRHDSAEDCPDIWPGAGHLQQQPALPVDLSSEVAAVDAS